MPFNSSINVPIKLFFNAISKRSTSHPIESILFAFISVTLAYFKLAHAVRHDGFATADQLDIDNEHDWWWSVALRAFGGKTWSLAKVSFPSSLRCFLKYPYRTLIA